MFLAPPFPFGSVIERNNLRGDLLTLAQAKEIHEIRKRFGVIGAYTTGKNYVLFQEPDGDDVFAAEYDDDGNLTMVEDEEVLSMCGEVLDAFDVEEAD